MITHLEPDILECEVKWALESITMNKAGGGDGIPVELFQILKDDAMKVLHSICQQFGKPSSGHRTGKGQFSCQSQRTAMPKNAQTTTRLHSSTVVFPGGSDGKASVCNVGDLGSIPGLGRCPAEGNGSPLQYSCLENRMDGGACWATVHAVAKSQT